MKIADFFTALRIALAPVFFSLFFFAEWTGTGSQITILIAIPLFIFMEFTDYLDGYFARKNHEVSDFGKIFDPFADVLANITVLFCFVLSGYLPAVFFMIILYREMGIMFLRMMALRKGVAMGARKGGKTKTVLYITGASISLVLEALARLGLTVPGQITVLPVVNMVVYSLAVLVSVFSFLDYVFYYRKLSSPETLSGKRS